MRMNMTQQITNRFLAPQIPKAIWGKYFKGEKMFVISEPDLLRHINGIMVCLTWAILCEHGKRECILNTVRYGASGPETGRPPRQFPAPFRSIAWGGAFFFQLLPLPLSRPPPHLMPQTAPRQ